MLSQEKPRLVCGDCRKTFSRLEHLKRHQKNHTGEKTFECPLCERKFSRSDNRKQHIRSHNSIYEQVCLSRKSPQESVRSENCSPTQDWHPRSLILADG